MTALLELGADIHYATESGRTPLAVATLHDERDMLDQLLVRGASPDIIYEPGLDLPLFAKVLKRGDKKLALYLLESGADINLQDETSRDTALIVLARIDRWDLVYWLLEHGADPNVKNYGGNNLPRQIDKVIAKNREPHLIQGIWFRKVQKHLAKQQAANNGP